MTSGSYSKSERILLELEREIAGGKHGGMDSPFMTTRRLMEDRGISLQTAHRVLGRLCANNYLEVRGRRYYIKNSEKSEQKVFGLLVSHLDSPYFSSLASAVEEKVRLFGGELRIATYNHDPALERNCINKFVSDGVSGILATPWAVNDNFDLYKSLEIPYVLIGRTIPNLTAEAVLIDNQKAAMEAGYHLIEQGCEEFIYVGMKNLKRDDRLEGFRLALLSKGRTLDAVVLGAEGEEVSAQLKKILHGNNKKIGVFCYHDSYAAGVITLCHEERIAVPEQLCVVGFDNLPIASAIYPALTTVSYSIQNIARIACEILFANLSTHNEGGAVRYLDTQLIIRKSTTNSGDILTK